VFSWIPAFAGMTSFAGMNDVEYIICKILKRLSIYLTARSFDPFDELNVVYGLDLGL